MLASISRSQKQQINRAKGVVLASIWRSQVPVLVILNIFYKRNRFNHATKTPKPTVTETVSTNRQVVNVVWLNKRKLKLILWNDPSIYFSFTIFIFYWSDWEIFICIYYKGRF